MPSRFIQIGALLCVAGIARAQYSLVTSYTESNFFDEFSFFTGPDPTAGFVDYQDAASANSLGLAGTSNGGIYLGVDDTTLNPSAGRASVRVTSNAAYTEGLFIADIAHMPGSICGVWPAFWTTDTSDWPNSGEIDIIEGVNQNTIDTITLHTAAGCSMNTAGSLGGTTLVTADNCNAGDANTGCGVTTSNTQGYGDGFNAIGGGVYAMEWTDSAISIWFFPRSAIPSDIAAGTPKPSGWGTPTTVFTGNTCNIPASFNNHQIIFDTTFCGSWAGTVWSSGSCASVAATCNDFVSANPSAFTEAYWLINYVNVYQAPAGEYRRGLTEKEFSA